MNLVKVLIKLLNIKRWTFLSHFQLRIFNIYVSPHSLILCSQNQLVMQHFFKESKETKAFVSRQLSWLCSYVCSVPKLCLTLQPHGLQHARFPCHSLSPAICSHSYPLSRWCCLTISFSVIPFSCSQSFPATGPLPMNWLFASGGQSIRASASSSVLSSDIQGWFPSGWAGLKSLLSKKLSSLLQHHSSKASIFFSTQPSLLSNSHICTWLLEKP